MKKEILEILALIRKEAGEKEIGTREVELVPDGIEQKKYWNALKQLSKDGMITRRSGWMWITDKGFQEVG